MARGFVILAPMLIPAFYGAIIFTDRFCLHLLYGERGFIENATVVFFILAGLFSLWNAFRWHRRKGRWHWFYLLFGVLLILVAMEEMSWGTHLVDVEKPEFFLQYNAQGELNLHNLIAWRYQFLFYVPLVIYCVLLPLATKIRPAVALRERGWLETMPRMLVPAFIVASLAVLRAPYYPDVAVLGGGAEVGEMMFAVCLAMGLVLRWRELYPGAPSVERREFAGWMAVALLVLAVMASLAFSSVAQQCNYPGNRALARSIEEQSHPEDAIIFIGDEHDTHTYLSRNTRRGSNFYVLPDDHTIETLDDILGVYREIYVVYFQDWLLDTDHVIEQTLTQQTYPLGVFWRSSVRMSESWSFEIRLERYLAPPPTSEAVITPTSPRYGEGIILQSYSIEPREPISPGDPLGVTLVWEATSVPEVSYNVFVHIYGVDGSILAQHDGVPGQGQFPTSTLAAGQRVIDRHGIMLPPDVAPGAYDMAVGLYDPQSGERVSVTLSDGIVNDRFYLTPVEIH